MPECVLVRLSGFVLHYIAEYVVIDDWLTANHSAYFNPCADYITSSFIQWLKEDTTIANFMRRQILNIYKTCLLP